MKQKDFLYLLSGIWCLRAVSLGYSWIYPFMPIWSMSTFVLECSLIISLLFNIVAIVWLYVTGTYKKGANSLFVVIFSGALCLFGVYAHFVVKTDLRIAIWAGALWILLHYSLYFFKKEKVDSMDLLKYAVVVSVSLGTPLQFSGISFVDQLSQFLLLLLVGLRLVQIWTHKQTSTMPAISADDTSVFEPDDADSKK